MITPPAPTIHPRRLPTRWRRERITLCGRFGPNDKYVCLESRDRLATFGVLCVHHGEPVVVKGKKHYDPTTWQLKFKHKLAPRNAWVITHITSGMRVSRGKDKFGYRNYEAARFVAEMLMWKYWDVLEVSKEGQSQFSVVDLMQKNPKWDEFVAFVRDLEAECTDGLPRERRRELRPADEARELALQRREQYRQWRREHAVVRDGELLIPSLPTSPLSG